MLINTFADQQRYNQQLIWESIKCQISRGGKYYKVLKLLCGYHNSTGKKMFVIRKMKRMLIMINHESEGLYKTMSKWFRFQQKWDQQIGKIWE